MNPRFCLLAVPLLLAACVNETTIPLATEAQSGRPRAAASPPKAAVTRFDGRYAGTFSLNPDRTRACPPAPVGDRELTIRQGRASLLLNPETRQVLSGTVGADGDVRVSDTLDRGIATTGLFTEDGFIGEHRNGLCTYMVKMTKRD